MNMQSKIWDTARTGNTVHAFNEEGKALCRSSITLYHLTNGLGDRRVSWAEASAWVLRTPGLKFCASCERKFEAAAETVTETVEAPASEEKTCCDHASMYHGNAGCDRCACTQARSGMVAQQEAAPVAEITTTVKATVTPEVIEALHLLRTVSYSEAIMDAINCLDNAGIFAAIDEATGYDLDPAPERCDVTFIGGGRCSKSAGHRPLGSDDPHTPERVSKCTCPKSSLAHQCGVHRPGCPGDPAEWGDMAYTLVPSVADNIRRAVGLKFE